MRGALAQKSNLAEIWKKKFNYFCSMNHHKLKHCEINFRRQLPAWNVWGLQQTSSAFFLINSYRMEENCNLKISIPRCSMNQKLLISLGKVVSIPLGSFRGSSSSEQSLAGTRCHLPTGIPGSALAGGSPCFLCRTHCRLMDLHPSTARESSATHWAGYGKGLSRSLSAFAYTLNKP